MLGSGTIHSQASMFVKIMFFFLHYLLQSAWSAASLKKNRKRDNFSDLFVLLAQQIGYRQMSSSVSTL